MAVDFVVADVAVDPAPAAAPAADVAAGVSDAIHLASLLLTTVDQALTPHVPAEVVIEGLTDVEVYVEADSYDLVAAQAFAAVVGPAVAVTAVSALAAFACPDLKFAVASAVHALGLVEDSDQVGAAAYLVAFAVASAFGRSVDQPVSEVVHLVLQLVVAAAVAAALFAASLDFDVAYLVCSCEVAAAGVAEAAEESCLDQAASSATWESVVVVAT